MNNKFLDFLREFFVNKTGILLAIVNVSLVFYFNNKNCWGKCNSGDVFNESLLFHIVAFLNLPAIMLGSIPFWAMGYTTTIEDEYLFIKISHYLVMFLAIIFQWFLFGYIIEKTYRNLQKY